ncbi:GNAT family N-acetyltransferase [Streptomyces sp. NPDC014894]|uniref:GNAT family N-acetyltransferase n=1 Tax=Streptomyces sp. NPDC014894 TaxID=3364931 RepID=UPI0036FACB25
MRVRRATAADLPLLQDIERAAGEAFRALGMAEIADDEPPPLTVLERFRAEGGAWVVVDEEPDRDPAGGDKTAAGAAAGTGPRTGAGTPLAYLLHEEVDGAAHVEQVSVRPSAGRRGLGRELIDRLADRARADGLAALTLTTFAEVPWNAPYYARLGFRVLGEAELTEGLREIRRTEREIGLDRWPRVCMRREL